MFGPVKFPMNTTKIAQYAALAANISCLAAFVSTLIAALKRSVNTISTPTALKVFLVVTEGVSVSKLIVLVRWYIATVEVSKVLLNFQLLDHRPMGMTSRTKMTKVMKMLTILSMRLEL